MQRYRILTAFAALLAFSLFLAACAHSGKAKHASVDGEPRILGFLQFKAKYANAARAEGGLEAIARVMSHRHSKTGKAYPCWNALKPFRKLNLPVSLSVLSSDDIATKDFFEVSKIDSSKFDSAGKDGMFSNANPTAKDGYQVWRVSKAYKNLAKGRFPDEIVGLVDISGSMEAKKKLNTIRGLATSGVRFKKIYVFSDKGSLKEIGIGDLVNMRPEGHTALYDNLAELMVKEPNLEIVVITDGMDNKSSLKFDELYENVSRASQKIDVVLTGNEARKNFFKIADASHGQTLTDLEESGYILEPYLEVSVDD